MYAKNTGIPYTEFKADWNNVDVPDARVKTRYNPWKKVDEEYNANAGFARNQEMAEYADACIVLQPNGNTGGSQDMLKRAKAEDCSTYVFDRSQKSDDEFKYFF